MVSRYLPHLDESAASNPLQFVEAAVSEALSPVAALLSVAPPLLPAHYPAFAPWRRHHEELEALVRRTGSEYVVVRAPSEVQACRPGARENMRVLSASQLRTQSATSLSIGALDLAECVVQSLLLERVSGVSFTVCAAPSMPLSGERASRDTYYSILSLDDTADPQQLDGLQGLQEVVAFDEAKAQEIYSEMRSTYIIRPVEAYRSQVEEDGQVEQFWEQLLASLDRDPSSIL